MRFPGRALYFATAALLGPVWVYAFWAWGRVRASVRLPALLDQTNAGEVLFVIPFVSVSMVLIALAFRKAILSRKRWTLPFRALAFPMVTIFVIWWLGFLVAAALSGFEEAYRRVVSLWVPPALFVFSVEYFAFELVFPLGVVSILLLRWTHGPAPVPAGSAPAANSPEVIKAPRDTTREFRDSRDVAPLGSASA